MHKGTKKEREIATNDDDDNICFDIPEKKMLNNNKIPKTIMS